MAISFIDKDKCVGCGVCVDTCPMDVIRMDTEEGKAVIVYPEDCHICEWCSKDCPTGAITVETDRSVPILMAWN